MSMTVSVPRLIRFLVLVAGSCIVAGIAGQVLRFMFLRGVAEEYWLLTTVVRLFDMNLEGNVPTWLSSCLLLLAALTAQLTACVARPLNPSESRSWTAIAIILCYLSLDEAAQIHETTNRILVALFGFPPGVDALDLVLVVVVAAYLLPFVYHLDARTRKSLLVGGFLFGAGAVGIEVVGHKFLPFYNLETLGAAMVTAVEESLEITGAIIFIYALLLRLAAKTQRIDICLAGRA